MKKILFLHLLLVFVAFSCRKEQYLAPGISGVGSDTIVLNIGDKIILAPNITNLKGNSYTWLMNGNMVATGQLNYNFEAQLPGNFEISFQVSNKAGTDRQTFNILVEEPIVIANAGPLTIPMCEVVEISPTVAGPDRDDYAYEWLIGDSVIGKTRNLDFISPEAGTFELTLRATAGKQTTSATRTITVETAQYIRNAYTVLEYAPAPGKFHNWSIVGEKSFWDYGFEHPLPYADFLTKASELRKTDLSASLFTGSWGGYASFKFDHTVANARDKADVEINAFFSNRDIPAVYVAYDANKNGNPDEEEWYEIKNDDYGLWDTLYYEITFTYGRTETDARRMYNYYNWIDNKTEPAQGEIMNAALLSTAVTTAGIYSTRGLFPGHFMDINTKEVALLDGWKNSFSRRGKLIKRNLTGAAPFFQKLNIDIDKAVNEKGESVQLPGIDFVKVRKVVYPLQQDLSTGGVMADYNWEETRMLQVGSIIDKHLKN
ncbi:MAG: PKD-like domain-containing protein [Candidatus Pseudobacter hemicellulosilyticus]|uniref:PKD-like domain-containing protein n=1 Tax=Candidatus Pseudobacter hemicellulosilyticus TaxID=3121375 RepID=A0AAJ6BFA1_9BACT|nr:MAG: PKD-like domain-containing protein [Pseudobacter sp.]